ncbi:hypothetical protein BY996DRAFT_585444 [Phakopsora pachyrhizi]|uniref:VOC domain-containing protein n=1 Tax=Phakopsora pachyrhizi TaxID=170000 RepID=A0AAV0BUX3_PHAPC|nr:hypothetical protein BY996DRAFT_585444 [Phakopsora pachyrhizi]CAH7690450.1 hypothetical protein PPACK8108_LOCUS25802 [Phakopsora pachyrhizi]
METFERPSVPDRFERFKFSRVVPSLEVSSLDDSIDFYTNSLPFYLSGRDRSDHCWLTLHNSSVIDHFTGSEQGSVNVYLRRSGFLPTGPSAAQPGHQPSRPESSNVHHHHDSGRAGVIRGLVYIRLDGNQKTFEEFYHTLLNQNRPISFSQPLASTPWGSLKFSLYDLDQNEIVFYSTLKPNSKA